ncbi:MAG: LamG-like jellyroll fold domain-containing protein [Bacteroidales bacterium]|nr:LamG-like jellyroll fold domain-containing protein [Bacteroidales bacterium]MDZ4205335.1 LamG-like jellyroll fold domain-containing protein [Bacteroidales bacterium]
MKRPLLNLALILISLPVLAQPGQVNISRIGQMPDLPVPLQIRNWNTVTHNYDSFVFDLNKTGQYLPLSRLGTQGQFNYPDNTPLFLDSYVGAVDHTNQAEAINILPAIVGASLAGVDKSNQNGMNWVAKSKDFFNLQNGQDVYLNNYSTTSGSDWWYDLMPNVYFYQLKSLYPDGAPEFGSQFTTVADRWLYCVKQLGGSTTPWAIPNMNYRAFNLATGRPLTTGVPEPESAGSLAWLLYNAYLETGNRKYFEGAQLAMDFLAAFETNPSYELQLPYGTLVAARMNAVEGTNYPLQKLLDWCFNRGALRGWGAIVGTWGGYDVSGLIGEANDGGNDYAFVMNGFQQAAALAPLPKYDKRYARAIAKWLLNVANASRLFYWNALPQTNQDSYVWASANDPSACIPYESMKEVWLGKTPFATGDAIQGGWAATNLSLYSGSSVGYLAAVINPTDTPEILQIDLNKTDFYGDNSLVSYLYFNPTQTNKQVNVELPAGTFGIYDAITETILFPEASGSIQLTLPAGEVRLIRLYSAGIELQASDGRLYAGDDILDYHYQYDYSVNLRIKSISTGQNPVITNSVFTAYCEPGNINPGDQVQFEWFMDEVLIGGQIQSQAVLAAPGLPAQIILKCRISANGQIAEDTLHLQVVEHIPIPPVVHGIQAGSKYTVTGDQNTFTALVEPAPGEILEYNWSASTGVLNQNTGISVSWQAPITPVVGNITVQVINQDMLSTTVSAGVLVKDTSLAIQSPLIWYPFDTDNRNAAADRFHATVSGVTKTADARGMPLLAYRFTSGQNIIYTENHVDLNFVDAVSLSCWVKCELLGSERFIISHGSWQQRYKLSITPEGRLRWTVKTNAGVADLDASAHIDLNRYYHVTALYTGYSMELYLDGVLDTFKAFSGAILPSTKPFTIGRMDNVETQYALRGSVDEVKLWDKDIPVAQVEKLKNQWATPDGVPDIEMISRIYPNPAKEIIYIEFIGTILVEYISLFTPDGREVSNYQVKMKNDVLIIEISQISAGLHLIQMILKDGRVVTRKIIIR